MYNETELFTAARSKGFAVLVQDNTATVFGAPPSVITQEMALAGFNYIIGNFEVTNVFGVDVTGVRYSVKQ